MLTWNQSNALLTQIVILSLKFLIGKKFVNKLPDSKTPPEPLEKEIKLTITPANIKTYSDSSEAPTPKLGNPQPEHIPPKEPIQNYDVYIENQAIEDQNSNSSQSGKYPLSKPSNHTLPILSPTPNFI